MARAVGIEQELCNEQIPPYRRALERAGDYELPAKVKQ